MSENSRHPDYLVRFYTLSEVSSPFFLPGLQIDKSEADVGLCKFLLLLIALSKPCGSIVLFVEKNQPQVVGCCEMVRFQKPVSPYLLSL